jgi:hypothetical protein
MKDRKVKQVLSGVVGYQWKREAHKERAKEGKYDRNIVYVCIKMEQ